MLPKSCQSFQRNEVDFHLQLHIQFPSLRETPSSHFIDSSNTSFSSTISYLNAWMSWVLSFILILSSGFTIVACLVFQWNDACFSFKFLGLKKSGNPSQWLVHSSWNACKWVLLCLYCAGEEIEIQRNHNYNRNNYSS